MRSWTLGIPDEEFFQRKPDKGLLTKSEVRVISLSKMKLTPEAVVWDIGAGTGSVAIEAALLAKHGSIYAIEKNRDDVELLLKNIEKFEVRNISVIHGEAPACLKEINGSPDAIFIGGSGGMMAEIINVCAERLKPGGRIVMNLITLENLHKASHALHAVDFLFEVTLASIARGRAILNLTRLEALNPVFILTAERKKEP